MSSVKNSYFSYQDPGTLSDREAYVIGIVGQTDEKQKLLVWVLSFFTSGVEIVLVCVPKSGGTHKILIIETI